jgi:putative membrane protein
MKRTKRFVSAACAGAVALAFVAAISGPARAQGEAVNAADQQFVTQAIVGGNQEILQARAELTSTSNPSVRLFAKTMIKDHQAANAEIASLARSEGLKVPPVSLSTAMPAALPDATYMSDEVAAHQKTIALFKGEMANGSTQMATVAGQIAPTLDNHLAMAQQYERTGRVSPEPAPSPGP